MNVCPCLPHKRFQCSIINVAVDSEGSCSLVLVKDYSPLIYSRLHEAKVDPL